MTFGALQSIHIFHPSSLTARIYTEKIIRNVQGYTDNDIHSSIISKSKKVEISQLSTN